MSYLNFYKQPENKQELLFGTLARTRSEVISSINSVRVHDVLVVGGGIHGAMFARIAALHGLKTVLLERADYAGATSSRSSKMLHGGLRYLEMLDIWQVLEGIKAREDFFQVAPHLARPHDFLIPIEKRESWLRFKLGLGLRIYDYFLKDPKRKHRWLNAAQLPSELSAAAAFPLAGAYQYCDGIMDDARLVIENIVAARQEGAHCLNYANVESVSTAQDGSTTVGWRDVLSAKSYEARAGIVVNCAGPWVPFVGRLNKPSALINQIKYSRGVHLLFDRPWSGPAVFRYSSEKGKHYFIWPHPAGTMVGPTDTEVSEFDNDPQPTSAEIGYLLGLLERDFPKLGLDRSTLHYAFTGIRTLPLRGSNSKTAALSRRHKWIYSSSMLNLVGGKYTTASWTVLDGFKQLLRLAKRKVEITPLTARKVPGAGSYSDGVAEFVSKAQFCWRERLQWHWN